MILQLQLLRYILHGLPDENDYQHDEELMIYYMLALFSSMHNG